MLKASNEIALLSLSQDLHHAGQIPPTHRSLKQRTHNGCACRRPYAASTASGAGGFAGLLSVPQPYSFEGTLGQPLAKPWGEGAVNRLANTLGTKGLRLKVRCIAKPTHAVTPPPPPPRPLPATRPLPLPDHNLVCHSQCERPRLQ